VFDENEIMKLGDSLFWTSLYNTEMPTVAQPTGAQGARAPTETSQQIFTDYEKFETCPVKRKVKSITGSVILSSCSCHERL